jgi:hypothetical protein
MSPENKVKALEAIDRWLELDAVTHWDFQCALREVRELIVEEEPEIWTSNQGAGASQ